MPRRIVLLLLLSCLSAMHPASTLAVNSTFLRFSPIASMTPEDVKIFHGAIVQVLENAQDGVSEPWNNPATGAGGVLTPLKTWGPTATRCRDLQIQNHAGGETGVPGVFTLCRQTNGGWRAKD